jgi:mannitol/fructose-specific phosphotransferase system IIA component (Ntr-type)
VRWSLRSARAFPNPKARHLVRLFLFHQPACRAEAPRRKRAATSCLAFTCAVNLLFAVTMAARLSSLLAPERIILSLQSTKRTAALQETAKLLEADPNVANFQGFYNELLARERLDTTCLGNEVALPHARTEHVKKIVLAVGRSDAGVLFENSNQNVKLMFVLGTPKNNPTDYLILVGALCRLIKDESSRAALLAAPTPEAFIATVVELENKILGPAK